FGGGVCKLLNSGVVVADLRPTIDTFSTWWQGETDYYPEYGGLIWFGGSNVYIGVRKTGPGSGITRNRIYRWPLEDAGGAIVGAAAISGVVTSGVSFYMHMDRGGTIRAIAEDEEELVTYDADLVESNRESLPMSIDSLHAFAVDSGLLILLRTVSGTKRLYIYDLDTFTLQQTIALSGNFAGVNHQIICSDYSIFVRSGIYVKRVDYQPSCLV